MRNGFAFAAGLAVTATAAVALAACDGTDPVKIKEPVGLPVTVTSTVNVQVTDAIIGTNPQYTITSSISAKQGTTPVSAKLDSIIVSYRLNDAPFVVGSALTQPLWVGYLPFVAQRGDHYTVYARLYSHGNGAGGKSAQGITDFNTSGMAIDTTQ